MGSEQPVHTLVAEYSMSVELLTKQHLEFLSSTGGYTGLSVSIHVKMTNCRISHVTAQLCFIRLILKSDIM